MAHPSIRCTIAVLTLAMAGAGLAAPWNEAQAQQRAALPPELFGSADPAVGRMETELELRAALDERDYRAARELAEQLVADLEQRHGRDALALAEPLLWLARAQRGVGELTEAEHTLHRTLDILRRHEGRYSENLLDPMRELGLTYQNMFEHDLAISMLTEAQGLARRVGGLLNLEQVDLIYDMARSLMFMGSYNLARERVEEAFRVQERHYGEDSSELLPAIYEYAGWQHRMMRFRQERLLYMRAIDIIEREGGPADMRLITPLRQLAASIRGERSAVLQRQGYLPDTRGQLGPRQALERAREIAKLQPVPDPAIEARILVDLGDWHMAERRAPQAIAAYSEAWELLEGYRGDLLRDWFAEPTAVLHGQPSGRNIEPLGRDPNRPQGYVRVRYRVDSLGVPRDLRVDDSEPSGLADSDLLRTVGRTRFRPRFVDGQPVDADNQIHEFRFAYRP